MKPKIVSLNDNGCLTATYLQTQDSIGNMMILRELTGLSMRSIILNRDNAEVLFTSLREAWPGIGNLDK